MKKHICNFPTPASKEGGWTCKCGEVFRTRALLLSHKKTCEECKETRKEYIEGTCPYCGLHKVFLKESFTKHVNGCKKNPNRVPYKTHHISDEQKKKQSETMKKKIEDGSFIVPYVRNHHSKISYPEKYFMEVFKGLGLQYNYHVGRYQLDFASPEKMKYIEIDGEQHYVDDRIVKHDIERTLNLKNKGWTCVKRVRWTEFQKLSEEEKKLYCKELISLI